MQNYVVSGAFSVLKRLGDALHRLWLFYLVIITLCIIGEPGAQGTVWPATQSRILGSPDEGASMPTPSLPSPPTLTHSQVASWHC